VSPRRGWQILASGVQGGPPAGHAPGEQTLLVIALSVALALALALAVLHLRRSRRQVRPVRDEWAALAVMGELCPHGWKAQVTIYGWGAPVPADAPASRVPLVELEWSQYDEQTGQVAVARRVWAPTIAQALEVMVEDRRTDLSLEQIEQEAAEDEELDWGDSRP
jgi:hypothetical protein